MKCKETLFLIIATIIAGSAWILIPSQVSTVPYSLSIGYRFIVGGLLMFIYCISTKRVSSLSYKAHALIIIQGFMMYCAPHWFNYNAVNYISTGVISLILALTIIPNTILGKYLSHDKVTKHFIFGAILSIVGVLLVFWYDLRKVTPDYLSVIGFSLVFTSILFTSSSTIISKKIMKSKDLSVIYLTSLAMLYGGVISLVKHFIFGGEFIFDTSLSYVLPLLYLSVIVTPIVFGIYLRLARNISAAYAGYIWLFMPILALNLSMLFEDFKWTILSFTGTILVIVGGYISLKNSERKKA